MVTDKSKANLKPFTSETARAAQPKSVDTRKENRTFKEIMEAVTGERGRKEAIIRAVVDRAEKGDLAAFDRVRDLLKEQGDTTSIASLLLSVSGETADVLKNITNGEQNK